MDVYFTSLSRDEPEVDWEALGLPELGPLPSGLDVDALYLRAGMPFLLDSDGNYDRKLNQFFRSLPIDGVPAPNSWKAYAYDLAVWVRFLAAREKTVWNASREDFREFKEERRNRHQIEAVSWNRSVAAISRFYDWAEEKGFVTSRPVRRYRSERLPHERNTKRGPGRDREREERVEPVSLHDFIIWRDVGLRGFTAPGMEDPFTRVRNIYRNLFMVEWLLKTGIRSEEAVSLLTHEWPTEGARLEIPGIIRKRGDDLVTRVPSLLRVRARNYMELERPAAVQKGLTESPPFGIRDPIYLLPPSENGRVYVPKGRTSRLRGEKSWTLLTKLGPSERERVIWTSAGGDPIEPGVLLLGESADRGPEGYLMRSYGAPLGYSGLRSVFRQASKRCRRKGFDLDVRPHMMRHTFAVTMLAHLRRRRMAAAPETPDDATKAAYMELFAEPLRQLQLLLGHRQVTSTWKYLNYLQQGQDIIDEAFEEFEAELELAETEL